MPPPRSALTSSFAVGDQSNEVVCPLKNHDGSSCRKRCLGEKRYRSMQEHIRRAHPEHYIAKLPATEESFSLMVNTPPHERPQTSPQTSPATANSGPVGPPGDHTSIYKHDYNFPSGPSRSSDEYRRGSLLPAANAAEVLAQLHHQRPELMWEQEHSFGPDVFSDGDGIGARHRPRFAPTETDPRLFMDERYPDPSRPRELLPSSLARSPPYYRSSTLPPGGRPTKPNRPRKSSITQSARKPKHERTKSKEYQRRMSYDRKAMSAEPSSNNAAFGKRWEDLIDAAASATEEDVRDLTPVPGSPLISNRASLPPLLAPHFQNHTYAASPLQRVLTPPPPDTLPDFQPFPSVESSVDSSKSGQNFHMGAHGLSEGLSDSSPTYQAPIQIYCAGCHRLSVLKDSYACTECICGICKDCVDAISSEQSRRRLAGCPKCAAIGGKFKPFQLDLR